MAHKWLWKGEKVIIREFGFRGACACVASQLEDWWTCPDEEPNADHLREEHHRLWPLYWRSPWAPLTAWHSSRNPQWIQKCSRWYWDQQTKSWKVFLQCRIPSWGRMWFVGNVRLRWSLVLRISGAAVALSLCGKSSCVGSACGHSFVSAFSAQVSKACWVASRRGWREGCASWVELNCL